MNDNDLFKQAMGDVKPLTNSAQQVFLKRNIKPHGNQNVSFEGNPARQSTDDNFLTLECHEWLGADDEISYQKDGVQHGVVKNLRLGKYEIQGHLSLLGKSVKEARTLLFEFIQASHHANQRVLLIQHGRGVKSDNNQATIKSFVDLWLPCFDCVLAFHSALKQHGGFGSVYVLLKKSEEERMHNRERHQKR